MLSVARWAERFVTAFAVCCMAAADFAIALCAARKGWMRALRHLAARRIKPWDRNHFIAPVISTIGLLSPEPLVVKRYQSTRLWGDRRLYEINYPTEPHRLCHSNPDAKWIAREDD